MTHLRRLDSWKGLLFLAFLVAKLLGSSPATAADAPRFSMGILGGGGYLTQLSAPVYTAGAEMSYMFIPHIEFGVTGRFDVWNVNPTTVTIALALFNVRLRPSEDRGFWLGFDAGYGIGQVVGGSVPTNVGGVEYEGSAGVDIPIGTSFSLGLQGNVLSLSYFQGLMNLKVWL